MKYSKIYVKFENEIMHDVCLNMLHLNAPDLKIDYSKLTNPLPKIMKMEINNI